MNWTAEGLGQMESGQAGEAAACGQGWAGGATCSPLAPEIGAVGVGAREKNSLGGSETHIPCEEKKTTLLRAL